MAAKLQSFHLDKTSILVILDEVFYRNSAPCISMRSNISRRFHKTRTMNKELCDTCAHLQAAISTAGDYTQHCTEQNWQVSNPVWNLTYFPKSLFSFICNICYDGIFTAFLCIIMIKASFSDFVFKIHCFIHCY